MITHDAALQFQEVPGLALAESEQGCAHQSQSYGSIVSSVLPHAAEETSKRHPYRISCKSQPCTLTKLSAGCNIVAHAVGVPAALGEQYKLLQNTVSLLFFAGACACKEK